MIELPTPYQNYIHKSRYARYLPDENRRETWEETVYRYIDFMTKDSGLSKSDIESLRQAVLNLDIMPSMRALMTAGLALDRDNVAGYNCAYTPIDNVKAFDEILYILMCGTGVGFSVERQYIQKLPEVAEEFHAVETVVKVADSKIGWASAVRQLISLLYQGQIPTLDVSKVRPAGATLKVFGGRASGPTPLMDLYSFLVESFKNAAGRQLTSIECHDIVCKIAEIVVVGGVRRSALISLSNLTDERMRNAKEGQFYNVAPHRAMANNSVAYTETPDMEIFMREWISLYKSRSGERGIFNRQSAKKQVPERRDPNWDFGTNPCSEIVLRPKQFCNLTEVVIRNTDSNDVLLNKVRLASILGTLQARLTDFRYLSKEWKRTCEEERLLGVSLTGIMDHPILNTVSDAASNLLRKMKQVAVDTNKKYAEKLGINQAAAVTCVKPSGTVSQLVDSASGIHARYAPYYLRRVRADKKDPLCNALTTAGIPFEDDQFNASVLVFTFPMKAPTGAVCTQDRGAIWQLEHWRMVDDAWCEHKPSVTINVKEHEWLEVAAWVYKHFDKISGVSFFPLDNHVYPQAPYEEITKQKYDKLIQFIPKTINLNVTENMDTTTSSQELACVGGACEL